MGDIRTVPLRGYNALRYKADAYGYWVSTPVVDFITDEETGLARPVTMIPFDIQAVCDPSQNITDLDHRKVFDNISQWVKFREDLARGEEDAAPADGKLEKTTLGDETPSLRDLGISGRACAPLERQYIFTVGDLTCYRREVIQGIKGVSKDALTGMDQALKDHDLTWLGEADFQDVDDAGYEDIM